MIVEFVKYQGAGNDFVMIDNISGKYDGLSVEAVRFICHRRFGVGADGLILINQSTDHDFEVDYYNADGSKSFCGNGARCSVAFVNEFIHAKESYSFEAIDGIHQGYYSLENIRIDMKEVTSVKKEDELAYVLNTGSPHYIQFHKEVTELNVVQAGKKIRFSSPYEKQGINVNFVQELGDNHLQIRTYERGVEDETLACGTGITAAAIAYCARRGLLGKQIIEVDAMGGVLSVEFVATEDGFRDIYLIGPAKYAYKGEVNVGY